ncbi:hypothetical protein L8R84_05835 [Vibrio splendidus]|uniref:hypothetical protein n=1 Tax=Vibrio splendidus TaxID=29497 RepID=UPI0024686F1B|nr:hypothetical protein [Vibrio splendidus]MDH5935661.1 hypothetical protein [Vibrio splendidus]
MESAYLDDTDHILIKALSQEDMPINEIAKKFEVPIANIAMSLDTCHFAITDNILRKNSQLGKMRMTAIGIEKRCSLCNQFFPLTKEFWHVKRTTKHGQREMGTCKSCEAEKKRRQELDGRLKDLGGKMCFSTRYLNK